MRTQSTLALIGWMLSTGAAYAGSPGWTVSEASGSVAITRAGVSNASFNRIASKGGKVGEGDIIATGPNGRAVIVRGEEYVIVAPNSRLRLVDTTETNTLTQFFQSAGNSVFKIKKKSTPHFGVQTPYLAAVVKGTTFSVTVTPTGAAIQVTEGRVQVSTLDGAATHLVIPGEIGMVSQGMPYRLTVQGAEPQIIDSPNRGQLLPKPDAAGGGKSEDAADSVASVEPLPSETPSPSETKDANVNRFEGNVVAAVTEGPVSLNTVTGGLVAGNSTLVSTVASTTKLASINPVEVRPVRNPVASAPIQVIATPEIVDAVPAPTDIVQPLPPVADTPPAPGVIAPPTGAPVVSPIVVQGGPEPVLLPLPPVDVFDPTASPANPASLVGAGPVAPEPVLLVDNSGPSIGGLVVDTPIVSVVDNSTPSATPPLVDPNSILIGSDPVLVASNSPPSGGGTPALVDPVLVAANPVPAPNNAGSGNSGPLQGLIPVVVSVIQSITPGNNGQGNNGQGNNGQGNNGQGNNGQGNNGQGNSGQGNNGQGNNGQGNNGQGNSPNPVPII